MRLSVLLPLVVALCTLSPVPAAAQRGAGALVESDEEEDGGSFAVPGIIVDAAGRNAFEAQRNGWRAAQRQAWPQLWARMTGATPAGAPRLSDAALDAIVAGFDIEREQIGPTRYIARLGVVFDRSRAGQYLGRSARVIRSSPMLLMPVLHDGGTVYAFERRTPWRLAWSRFRESSSAIDYVRPAGTLGDALMLPAAQAFRPDRNLWRTRFDRYGVADVLVAEARLVRRWPGGPVVGNFRALHGPDARELVRFTLEAASSAELPAMLDRAVARMDEAYTAALRDGRLFSESDLLVDLPEIPTSAPVIGRGLGDFAPAPDVQSVLVASIATPDAAELAAAQAALGAVPGVLRVTAAQVGLGGTSLMAITYNGPVETLRFRADQAGWRLEALGGGYMLRRRGAGEAALPDPRPPVLAEAPASPPAGEALPADPLPETAAASGPASAPATGSAGAPATPANPERQAPANAPGEPAPGSLPPAALLPAPPRETARPSSG